MDAALEKLTKQELVLLLNEERKASEEKAKLQASIQAKQQEVDYLKAKVAQLQRMLFGQKRERFENPDQLLLPFSPAQEQIQQQEEALTEKIEYVRKKQQKTAHKGRVALPDHLPVEEVEIYPEGDLSEMTCIGKEITEELECVPARFFIRRYIRYKYAPKTKDAVLIGELPERVIDRGIPGPGLIASILVDKYVDHMPLYRQRQRFLRENIPIPASTLDGWARQGMERLSILYEHLVEDIKGKGYLQVDESPIRVLDSNKKGACHKGYYWVYHCPLDNTVLFNYQPTRAEKATSEMLKNFKGYLQSDGYSVYKKIAKRTEVTHLVCWAHARREYEKALTNDRAKAQIAMTLIQQLYAVEAKARDGKFTAQERKELRLEKALPVINAMGKWISQTVKETFPKSQIGKAMQYCIERWSELSVYLFDGELEIDNNLVENAIRPVALGRKNYLFAGSHDAAQRAAMMYTFFAICKKHDVNPYQWLKYTLENIMSINHKNIKDLYPQNFKNHM
jgi:transposase